MSLPPPITCHCLNTVSGTPAAALKATLTLLSSLPDHTARETPTVFTAITNDDGRVKEWSPSDSGRALAEVMDNFAMGQRLAWSIKFDIGPWYEERGIESFWPEVEVKFYVKKGERHYHVPVLVGPWSYTTYRGS